MRIINDVKLDFSDVLILPKRSTLSSRSEVNLFREFKFKYSKYPFKGVPIIASNMDTIGTISMSKVFHNFEMGVCLHKFIPIPEIYDHFCGSYSDYTWYSLGITETDLNKWKNVLTAFKNSGNEFYSPKRICIDVANGYQEQFVDFIKRFRDAHPNLTIMAGSVCTAEMTEELILSGADIARVGIGSGSPCTTRIKAGVGVPQLSAVVECADAAHGLGGCILSDGGCITPGDFGKAFGAGADFIMAGGIFAGHDECEGEYTYKDGEITGMKFYGMSSLTAQKKYGEELKEYRASEGRTIIVPYKGQVANTVKEILGGLRSTCSYVGASKLKELSKRCTFIRVQNTHNTVFENRTIGI